MSSQVLGCQEVWAFFYSVTENLDKLFGQPNKSFEIGAVVNSRRLLSMLGENGFSNILIPRLWNAHGAFV